MTKAQLLQAAIDTWGVEAQLFMAVEEMAELTQALSKAYRSGVHALSVQGVIEELVDVRIMLDQIAMLVEPIAKAEYFFDIATVEKSKLTRLAARLDTTYEPEVTR